MEEFEKNVSIDYFIGRRVAAVQDSDKGVWQIVFEGGAMILNYDENIPKPATLVGTAMTKLILGSHVQGGPSDGSAMTRVFFGLEEVKLNPMEYAMVDDTYTKGQIVYPQHSRPSLAARAEAARPLDPSAERAGEGPEPDA